MKYQKLINVVIAADDLHYDPSQRRFFSLSSAEALEIQQTCQRAGIKGLEEVHAVVQWCGLVRVGEILFRSFMSGQLRIVGVKDKEPVFAPLRNPPGEPSAV